jgi:hypothetical protein
MKALLRPGDPTLPIQTAVASLKDKHNSYESQERHKDTLLLSIPFPNPRIIHPRTKSIIHTHKKKARKMM